MFPPTMEHGECIVRLAAPVAPLSAATPVRLGATPATLLLVGARDQTLSVSAVIAFR
jgi:hypothetical protein